MQQLHNRCVQLAFLKGCSPEDTGCGLVKFNSDAGGFRFVPNLEIPLLVQERQGDEQDSR